MNEDKKIVSFEEAVKLLPTTERVHTFRQAGMAILGADHDRERLLSAMKAAPEIQVTGPAAQAVKHGLAIHDKSGWLLIEAANAEPSPDGDQQP